MNNNMVFSSKNITRNHGLFDLKTKPKTIHFDIWSHWSNQTTKLNNQFFYKNSSIFK